MKAICFEAPKVIKIMDVKEPICGREDVILNVKNIGLCGTDLNSYRGKMPLVKYPRIPGHEISGIVIEKGVGVPDSINIDDKVMVSPYTNCGLCPPCRKGRFNTCENNQTLGVQREGALREKISIHYSKIFSSDNLTLDELVLVEPLSVGYHAANRGKVSEIDLVLLFGCGTIGIGALLAVLRKGATALVVDIDDNKLKNAKKFGAHFVVNSRKEDVMEFVNDLTNGRGVDVVIETAGSPETYKKSVEVVSFGGRVVYVGYSHIDVVYDTTLFVKKELNIYGSRNALNVFPSVIKMLELRERQYTDLITKKYSFTNTHYAFDYWDNYPEKINKILIDVSAKN